MRNDPRLSDSAAPAISAPSLSTVELLRETERELLVARQKLQTALEDRAVFLSELLHAARTPMTGVVGMCDLLTMGSLLPVQREYLSALRESADQLMSLFNDVCDLARAEAGAIDFEWIGFRLSAVLDDVAHALAPQARRKRLELVFRVGQDVPDLLVGDPQRVRQLLTGLVENSIRLTREGEVLLDVQCGEQHADEVTLRLAVADTGTPIAPEHRDRVLMPFLSSSRGAYAHYPITPLGMPLVAALAAAMGGQFAFNDDPQDATRYEATIRMLKQTASAGQPNSAAGARLDGLRAVLIEPNIRARQALATLLTRQGMSVQEASDIQQAREMCAPSPPDYLFVGGWHETADWSELPARAVVVTDWLDTDLSKLPSDRAIAVMNKPALTVRLAAALRAVDRAVCQQMSAAQPADTDDAPSVLANGAQCEPQAAIARLGGDVGLYGELVQRFLDDNSQLVPKIQTAIELRDAAALHRAAHSLKGVAATCGAVGVAQWAEQLEQQSRLDPSGDLTSLWLRLQQVLADTRQELAPYYKRPS